MISGELEKPHIGTVFSASAVTFRDHTRAPVSASSTFNKPVAPTPPRASARAAPLKQTAPAERRGATVLGWGGRGGPGAAVPLPETRALATPPPRPPCAHTIRRDHWELTKRKSTRVRARRV